MILWLKKILFWNYNKNKNEKEKELEMKEIEDKIAAINTTKLSTMPKL